MVSIIDYDFNKIYAIFEDSFRIDEIRKYENQKKLLKNKNYHLLGEFDSDRLIAVMAYWELKDYYFIEHLATVSDRRNEGIGKKMLLEFISKVNKSIVLEVELPSCSQYKYNDDYQVKRIGFYERIGFHYNDFPYIQPSIDEGREEIPLALMTYPNNLGTASEFNICKNQIYSVVYQR